MTAADMAVVLTVLVARNPALSRDEFDAEWRAHGEMIGAEPAFRRYIRSYEQRRPVRGAFRAGGDFDGVAIQRYASMEDFHALLATPEYASKMQPDETRILDMDRTVVLFTHEPETFIP